MEEPTDWEKLQSSNTENYLNTVIMPVLLPAMHVLDVERPLDPISFLAHYILRHKDRVKLPEIKFREEQSEQQES